MQLWSALHTATGSCCISCSELSLSVWLSQATQTASTCSRQAVLVRDSLTLDNEVLPPKRSFAEDAVGAGSTSLAETQACCKPCQNQTSCSAFEPQQEGQCQLSTSHVRVIVVAVRSCLGRLFALPTSNLLATWQINSSSIRLQA